jgi:hypothetical protein
MTSPATRKTNKEYGASSASATANGMPSLFASSSMSNTPSRKNLVSGQRKSYLHKRGTSRPKVNILALVDDAIEDGATNEAKQKASAERAASTAPLPSAPKKLAYVKRSPSIAEEQIPLPSISEPHSIKQKSVEKLSHTQKLEEEKKTSANENNFDQKLHSTTLISQMDNPPQSSTSTSIPSAFGSSSSNSVSSTPAWKARLKKQGKKLPEPVPHKLQSKDEKTKSPRILKSPTVSPKAQQKPWQVRQRTQQKKIPKPTSCEIITSRNHGSEASPKSEISESAVLSISPNDDASKPYTEQKGSTGSVGLIGSAKEKKSDTPLESKPKKMNTSVGITIVKPNSDNYDVTSSLDTDRKGCYDTTELIETTKKKTPLLELESETKPKSVDPSSKIAAPTISKPNANDDDNVSDSSIHDEESGRYVDIDELVDKPFEELNDKDSGRSSGKKPVTIKSYKVEEERSDDAEDDDNIVPEKIKFLSPSEGADTTVKDIPHDDIVLCRLRQELEDTKKRLENVTVAYKRDLLELEKETASRKETVRFPLMKEIYAQKMKNEKQNKEYQKLIDLQQVESDELRAGNQRFRVTLQRLPKQMAEVIASDQSLEKSNEEIASHLHDLRTFSQKLQNDQDQLLQSSDKCKNEYLPRYRYELWESKQALDAEIKIKNLYRDCNIKITKKIEKSKQVGLIEDVTLMVLETEGDVNPKFDPKFLSKYDIDSDDSDSDSDDSDSDSDSDSD